MGYSKKKQCNRQRVTNMWNKNPNCHWCNVPTVRVVGSQKQLPPNTATFDHVYHKSHPLRKTRKGKHLGVLACYDCNQTRGREAHINSLPAWNRFLIKHNIAIPVWKIRKKIEKAKRKFKFITKKIIWVKRHIRYRLKKRTGDKTWDMRS